MTDIISKNPLVVKIVDETASDEIKELLTEKQLPLTEEEYLEGFCFLLKEDKFRVKCLQHLKGITESVKANYVRKQEANTRVMYFVLGEALVQRNVKLVSHIIRNRMTPVEFLEKIAEKGIREMLEVLLDNQIKMIAFPYILDIIEKNPNTGNFIRGKITEIREYYLKSDEAEEIPEEAVLEDAKEIMQTEEEVDKESEKITDEAEEKEKLDIVEEEEYKKEAVSLLQIINQMSTSERIKLALTGSRSHRMILIKDPNKLVAMSVLESPKISINEVSLLVRNRSVSSDVITRISARRDWIKNYDIALELVKNPKTPLSNAVGFIKRLHTRDLMAVMRDKNLSPVIRNMAVNYHREKSRVKK